jgi:alanine racemase
MKGHDVPTDATGVITVDLARLRANWLALAKLVAPAECGAVVKADAYGLGAARVIPALAQAGCRTFFIATPDEAKAARRLAPQAAIFALDGLLPGCGEELLAAGATPVLSSLHEIAEWTALAASRGMRLPAALQIDTGLNRLGLSASDVDSLARDMVALGRLDIRLVMSHLASADDPADSRNDEQRRSFDKLRAGLPASPASLAASDGLMLGTAFHYDLVRPGYALYGGQAFKGGATPVNPVVAVQARVLQVRDVALGQSVGYSGTWRAQRQSRIAVVAAGYADGFARALSRGSGSGGGMVALGGRPAPVVGRVSMDLITVDVTDLSDTPIQRGDRVDLIGPGLTIESMGARAGTIGYEVLTRLGPRFHRVYLDGER